MISSQLAPTAFLYPFQLNHCIALVRRKLFDNNLQANETLLKHFAQKEARRKCKAVL